MLNQTGSWAFSALIKTGGILSGALNIILVPIFVIFFLLGHDTMINFLESLIPPRNRKSAQVFFRKLDGVATSWFRGQIEVLLILALVYGTGLGLVFGLSGFGVLNGFAVGALTGVLNIIPYVGIATGFILAMAMTLIEWNGIGPVIGVAAVYGIAQIADGYFITPRIVGTKVGLSTLWVLIALLVGGALAGFLGMLFAVPVAALIGAAWPDVVKFYRSTDFYNKE
jgi:predicted PurR-regulated permease PerM